MKASRTKKIAYRAPKAYSNKPLLEKGVGALVH